MKKRKYFIEGKRIDPTTKKPRRMYLFFRGLSPMWTSNRPFASEFEGIRPDWLVYFSKFDCTICQVKTTQIF